ncbi:hypothetical protein NHF46_01150 [Arthrobacter alpinus]|nr:hypothetical protein [Arthrobacter alpinus]
MGTLLEQAETAQYVLTLDCPDSPGIVHQVSGALLEQGSDIIDLLQFSDRQHLRPVAGAPEPDGHFFMRLHFSAPAGNWPWPGCGRSWSRWRTGTACAGRCARTGPSGGC